MNVRIYGERLRDARVVQSLLSKDVASRAGIAPSQLTRLERSPYTDVNPDTAEHLATALSFPIEFLSSEPTAAIKPGSTLFRARRTMTRKEEEQLHTWSRLNGQVLVGVVEKVKIPVMNLPSPGDFHDAQSAARATRAAFGLDEYGPIPHTMRVLERNGIPIASLDFDAEIARHDAFSCWVSPVHAAVGQEWPVLVVRVLNSWERTRFSTAHELGHLVMHRGGIVDDDEAERAANDFARHFLLPATVLESLWPPIPTLNSIMSIKVEYGIALSATIEHAWREGLVSDDRRTSFYKQLSNRKDAETGLRWREREPGWNDREVERPRLLARMIEAVYGDGLRLGDISNMTGHWPPLYLRRALAGQMWSGNQRPDASSADRPPNVVSFMRRAR
jgi:Zn-dependent peptidase ImmA (M78 family)/transcriptional regulator with XRE-family HTH domain